MLFRRRTGGFGALVEVPELGVVLCQRTRTGCKEGGGVTGDRHSPPRGEERADRTNVTRYKRETEREKTREN